MTTQHTEHEHNEAQHNNSVDDTVVASQYTPETSVAENTSSSHEEASALSVSQDNTSQVSASDNAPVVEQASTLEETAPVATTTFAEETGNTIPELSTFVHGEDMQTAVGDIQTSTTQEEVPPSASTEHTQTPTVQEEVAPVERTELATAEEQVPSSTVAEQFTPEMVDAAAAPVFVEESGTVLAEVTPSLETNEELVRPFSSFIEEFHQAEAEAEARAEANLSVSLQESSAESFAEFATPEMDAPVVDQPISLEEALPPVDFGEGSAFVPNSNGTTTVNVADVNAQSLAEAAATEQNQRVAAVTETNREEDTKPAVQRPVSPLLRPALRPRPARHGVTRHRDEPVTTASTTAITGTAAMENTSPQETSTPEQPVEAPKPPRRYRFDRPASHLAQTAKVSQPLQTPSVSKPAQATPGASNNSAVLTPPPAMQPTPTFARVEESVTLPSKAPTTNTPATTTEGTALSEQQSGGLASVESTGTVATPVEQGRRRHGSERQHREKEQAVPVVAPASVEEMAIALVADNKEEEVAPEDMPPLEYAELQKANSSRRRRRHRTATSGTSAAKETVPSTNGTQPIVEPSTPAQQAPLAPNAPVKPATPATPATPAAATNPYTIVSGYTVGQMNQGNEASGPFMGPEPSPARGSVNTTRDGRTVRVESQPLRTTSYPTVGHATGTQGTIAPASMNHFANIVSQAIQTQTDRMVAELRRANQAPTNVSVSLPPFPSTERVGVFVDVANLLYSARTQRIAIDFGKLLDFLRGNRRLVRAHAYCPTSPQPGDEQMFLTAVKGLGYRITTKNYKTFASGAKKADLDLDLCMDVVRLVDGSAVDCIVLVSGDSDFMPMLDYCSDHGVRVEVAAFDEAMSATLRQSCDLFVSLSMLEEIRA
ncbi:MAG: hypothetical protein NVS4B12_12780 [Ktedonobacteraceae bacterium]